MCALDAPRLFSDRAWCGPNKPPRSRRHCLGPERTRRRTALAFFDKDPPRGKHPIDVGQGCGRPNQFAANTVPAPAPMAPPRRRSTPLRRGGFQDLRHPSTNRYRCSAPIRCARDILSTYQFRPKRLSGTPSVICIANCADCGCCWPSTASIRCASSRIFSTRADSP